MSCMHMCATSVAAVEVGLVMKNTFFLCFKLVRHASLNWFADDFDRGGATFFRLARCFV